jgi:hypothetical protein
MFAKDGSAIPRVLPWVSCQDAPQIAGRDIVCVLYLAHDFQQRTAVDIHVDEAVRCQPFRFLAFGRTFDSRGFWWEFSQ